MDQNSATQLAAPREAQKQAVHPGQSAHVGRSSATVHTDLLVSLVEPANVEMMELHLTCMRWGCRPAATQREVAALNKLLLGTLLSNNIH